MTEQEIRDNGATHTNGKSYYREECLCEDDKPEWYRWNKNMNCWVEILNKPRNIKPLS